MNKKRLLYQILSALKYIAIAVVALFIAVGGGLAMKEYDIWIAISGNAGPDDDFNPITAVYQKWPQYSTRVLGFINYHHPRRLEEIQSAIGMSEVEANRLLAALQKCSLVRWDSEKGYQVTFAVFDDDVWTAFKPAMLGVADTISQKIRDDILPSLKARYEESRLRSHEIPFGIVATLITGAFGLDESGIHELQQHDLIRVTKKQPGDRNYVILSGARNSTTRFPLYGIHSDTWNTVYYATFGENAAMNRRRTEVRTLPNLVWNWQSTNARKPEEVDNFVFSLSNVVRHFGNDWFSLSDLRKIVPNESSEILLQEWTEYSLVEKKKDFYRIGFPVFSSRELEQFQKVTRDVGTAVLKIVQESYPSFKEAYLKTNPSSHGVPLQDVLDLVYHHTYSLALDGIISRHPDLRFSKEDDDLRYTGYAVLR